MVPAPQVVATATAWKAVFDTVGVQTSHAPLPVAPPVCPAL
jgi:hypothetical protein